MDESRWILHAQLFRVTVWSRLYVVGLDVPDGNDGNSSDSENLLTLRLQENPPCCHSRRRPSQAWHWWEHQHQHNPLMTGCLLFKSWEIMIFQSTFKVISFFWMLKEQAPHKIYCQSKTWWRETYLKPALESTSVSIALWYYIGADQHLICINNIENENGRELFCSTQVCNCVSSLHFAEFCLSN